MEAKKIPVKRLSRDEFASAVQKGLGRALLHVMHYGIDDVADLILDACLYNSEYDAQCEYGRGEWLFKMIRNLPQYPEFRVAILDGIATESDDDDLSQICELVLAMAKEGDQDARTALRSRVFADASDSSSETGSADPSHWVDLEGIAGLLDLARIYGRQLLAHPDASVPDWPLYNRDETKQALIQHSPNDPEIKAYYDFLEAHGIFKPSPPPDVNDEAKQREIRNKARQTYTLDCVLRDAQNKVGDGPYRYYRFGRYAEPQELAIVFERLLAETDPAVQVRLLWVFRRAAVPALDGVLFQWANDSDDELRGASISALSNVIDPKIHDLARAKLASLQIIGPDDEALRLFLNNYEPDDAHLIAQALDSLHPGPDDVHQLGVVVIALAEKYKDPELVPALLWAYENEPCSICRTRVVEHLEQLHRLPEALRHECLYDCDEDIRAAVQPKDSEKQ